VVFWLPSVKTWRRLLWTAGFDDVRQTGKFTLHDRKRTFSVRHVVHAARKSAP
jgi:hypothetical protein